MLVESEIRKLRGIVELEARRSEAYGSWPS